MTTETLTTSSGPYTGTGAADQEFAVTFQSAGADQIRVYLDGDLVAATDWEFARDDDGRGTVTATLDGEVYITSLPSFAQETEFQRFGPYFPDLLNPPLDLAARRDLYLKNKIDGIAPAGSELPGSGAGMYVARDAEGNAVFSEGTGNDSALRTDLAAAGGSSLVGGGAQYRATRSLLAAATSTAPALFTESGREGLFVWDASSLVAAVTADPNRAIYIPPSSDTTGASGAWVRVFYGGRVMASWFGASGAGDKTAELQAACDWLIRSPIECKEKLVIGDLSHTGITLEDDDFIVKVQIELNGVLTNTSANTPHFHIEAPLMWGWEVTGRGLATYSTAGNSSTKTARCFIHVPAGCVFYNSTIDGPQFRAMHYVVDSIGETWGLAMQNLPFIVTTGGIRRSTYAAGQPRCSYSNIYADLPDAIGPIFATNATNATYNDVELNSLNQSPCVWEDVAGGSHDLTGKFAIEGGTYAVSGRVLADVQNSTMTWQHIAITDIDVTQELRLFKTSGEGKIRGGLLTTGFTSSGAGVVVCAFSGDIRFGDIRPLSGTDSFGAKLLLTDIVSTAAADSVYVEAWGENRQPLFVGDAAHTILYDGEPEVFFNTELTAARKVILPAATQMWSGRVFEIRRTVATGAFALNLRDAADANTLASIAGGAAGVIRATFNRSLTSGPSQNWVVEKFLQP